jgi:hypothetical protein
MSHQVFSHAEIKVQRPSGDVEMVRTERFMTPALFAQMAAATKSAGRGTLISFENISTEPVMSAEISARLDAERAAANAADAEYNAGYRRVMDAMTRATD